MYTLRRWWDRHRIQIVLVSLTLGVALFLRQTQGFIVFELYQALTRPLQGAAPQQDKLANARVIELQQRLIELESQNQELKKVLGYAAEKPQAQQIAAPVIGRSSDHWWRQVLLGRGSHDRIRAGYVVMAPGGLVGRVVDVTPNTSRVLLLSDPANQVGVTVSRSRAMGYIRGQDSNRVTMEFFDKVPDVKRGDIIATSPFSPYYPAGLPVGRVESVDFSKSPAPEAVIELSAPISSLEWIVVQPHQPDSQPKQLPPKSSNSIEETLP
jgi:rod shape-determining protein MreC